MKRVRQSGTRYIPPVRLYWEDVEELAKLVAPDGDVKVVSGDFEYESLDELQRANAGKSISSLRLSRCGGTGVSIDIEKSGVWVFGYGPDLPEAAQVVMFLRERSAWYLWSSRGRWWAWLWYVCGCLTMLLLGAVLVALTDADKSLSESEFWSLTALALGVPWLFLGRDHLVIGSKIFAVRSTETTSFWERNRDYLIRDLIVVTIGAVVGYLLTKIFG